MRLSMRVRVTGVALAALAMGCLYDPAQRCGPGEVLDQTEVCVCAPGNVPVYRDITVITPAPMEKLPFSSCVPCGTHEVAKADQCVCAVGFVRSGAACVPSNLGATCAADADCAAGDQTFCHLPVGYCTKKTCASNADCNVDADYACALTETPTYCKRPPVGQGGACTMVGPDPACGPEAPLCVLNACAVSGCKTDADCSPSRKCCDFTKFGQPGLTLCFPGACP
ncbi:MAG: hypothetical protein QOI66_884 [Myxococcales bacterium]|nr:hypothetical protein [Myxococcales bacterium]